MTSKYIEDAAAKAATSKAPAPCLADQLADPMSPNADIHGKSAIADILDFQVAKDFRTLRDFAEMCGRIKRTGSEDALARLEEWLWAEYDDVSKTQGRK